MQTTAVYSRRQSGRALRHLLAWLTACALVLANSACSQPFWDDRCGVESRTVVVSARFAEPQDPEAGYVQLDLLERDRDNPERSIWWVLMSETMKGHILEARLLEIDGATPPTTLFELPVETGIGEEALRGQPQPYQFPIPFEELWGLLLSNRVVLELVTDLPGRELLRQTLTVGRFQDWSQAHCG
jgi:hypothetical protein